MARVFSFLLLAAAIHGAAGLPAWAGETRAAALSSFFQAYYKDLEGGKAREPMATLKEIGALFAGRDVKSFKWGPKFVYADLVKFNDLLNLELEKEGHHAYIVEQQGKNTMYFRCLLGKLYKKETAKEFEVFGKRIRTDLYYIGDVLVGQQPFLRFQPSFYSDRKRIYCVRDTWRDQYAATVYRRFGNWKQNGIDPKADADLDKLMKERNEDNCQWQLVYRAWRPAFLDSAAKGDGAKDTFLLDCAEKAMQDILWEEVMHALLNEKVFQNHDEATSQLVGVARAQRPHVVLGELFCYRKQDPKSEYRQAYDKIVGGVSAEVLKLAKSDKKVAEQFGDKPPASADEVRNLLFRLDEKTLQRAAQNLLATWKPK